MLLLVFAMLLSVVACGQTPATEPSTAPTEPTTAPTEPSTPTESVDSADPWASFAGDITVAEFYALDAAVDYSTTVFTMKGTVLVEAAAYYSKIYLVDGNTKVTLYCSGANQYGFLKVYDGQEVTVEIVACNWNNKTYWRGCVLSVVHEDGTKTINALNFR